MAPNANNFFLFELPIITFCFFKCSLDYESKCVKVFSVWITPYYVFLKNLVLMTPNVNNFFLFELPIIMFLEISWYWLQM